MQKMNPEVKAQWLAALRSGEYEQGYSQLTTVADNGSRTHCCLGVLCDLAVKSGKVDIKEGGVVNFDALNYLSNDGRLEDRHYLPETVMDWAGLADHRGQYSSSPDDSLAERNDSGATFAEIADLIEQHF